MEGHSSRDRYQRRSSRPKQAPKQLPKSFLDDDEEPQYTGRVSRRGSGAGLKTANTANIPSTFLDDDEEDDEKLWFRRSRARHARGTSWRSSMDDATRPMFSNAREAPTSRVTSGTNTPRDGSTAPAEERGERRARSQSIARSRSRYRKAPPKIQTNTDSMPVLPATTPTSAHPHSAGAALGGMRPPMTAPATKLTHDPIPLDVYRQYVTQMQPTPTKQTSAESLGSGPKTSGSDSTSSSSEGFDASRILPQRPRTAQAQETVDPNQLSKVMVVLSRKSRETFHFKHSTTVGELLDWACKKDAMTLRGAAILIERLPGFGYERALHESELLHTVVDAMECRKDEATLYLDVDVIKSGNLRATPEIEKPRPSRLVANFYYAKGEDANIKIRSKRYLCLDDAKLTMSRMSSRAKSEKSSHVCNIMEYGVYTVGQYGRKRDFDVPSKYQYIIIMKALSSKQMFIDQSRFFHYLATDSQEQYFEWVKALNDWRTFTYQSKERTKAAESQLIAKLEQDGVSSPEISETKLARLLTETKLTQAMGDGLKSPGLVSPKGGLVSGAKNAPGYQAMSEKSPSTKGVPDGPDAFLTGGLLGAAYDKKVELRNMMGVIETAPVALERKGTLIQKAGSKVDAFEPTIYSAMTSTKPPKAGKIKYEDEPTIFHNMSSTRPPKTPIRERGEDRGRQGQRKETEMTFYRDQTTSPPTRLQTSHSHGSNGGGPQQSISPIGAPGYKPLLNFDEEEEDTYKYKKKITGHGVEVNRNAGPLIKHATEPINPNASNPINRSISTRMGPGKGPHVTAGGRVRSATLKATSTKKRFDNEPMFESNGLLASVPVHQPEGHGIATGRHGSTKPLLNMSLNSNFVPGSLLEQHERVKEGGPAYKKTAMYREVY